MMKNENNNIARCLMCLLALLCILRNRIYDISLFEGDKNQFYSSDRFTADVERKREKKNDGRGLTTVR